MPKVSLYTVGCKLNQYETELIAQKMIDLGFERVDWAERADIYIINSCSVTLKAAADSRRKLFAAKRSAPDAKVVITGCYAQIQPELLDGMPDVDLVVSNDNKDKIISMISQFYPEMRADQYENGNPALRSLYKHSRALIKIQDGCNQKCSYCVIPLGRGEERSRDFRDIIEEIRLVSSNQYKEAILTGVHIGRYKFEGNNLTSLLSRILDETDIERIRLSSVEVNEISDELIKLCAENNRICPHFHIPLQSGSDRILRSMNRPYRTERYKAVIERLKSKVANSMVGADIIVGFPGEEDDDFGKTMEFVDNSKIDYLHVFSYSDHPRARSFNFDRKVAGNTIKDRNKILTDLGHRKWNEFLESQLKRELPVLFEKRFTKDSGLLTGLSDNYIRVECSGGAESFNTIQKVRPKEIIDGHIRGELKQ
ncbi:MAG: tRNA (N(6)-L-threonylcarbamoyladenosine(37)-C(2))-methylthiotransferase MtaB [candidate division Zixibacteria bacterium]|nr:tRNA (N(6)-L-threonylcarbamoyladenosine(37)-C(2))-methylthiotransferase MtaB [candidate division Zixibacteria bacterium]NIR67830.1 tRNA (N(6)-L-threonylcarbamoyladenosine(37)-C(2))-methylthiotransferase MtaB [candidate division Zixibacteria bacterium]NIS15530.1 tRNA (N(6)-L-threonylcarbamoyladenosine(37)-C(2))-methylthiotransferase MtaB [candidate division Zixibacteria bacterium]NIS49055.1 tRNA (N(6)-L-threonylcarbamoyladenosine(37)-C(2))-methylthiotransferase MtaB [candidate division Zixibac